MFYSSLHIFTNVNVINNVINTGIILFEISDQIIVFTYREHCLGWKFKILLNTIIYTMSSGDMIQVMFNF